MFTFKEFKFLIMIIEQITTLHITGDKRCSVCVNQTSLSKLWQRDILEFGDSFLNEFCKDKKNGFHIK